MDINDDIKIMTLKLGLNHRGGRFVFAEKFLKSAVERAGYAHCVLRK